MEYRDFGRTGVKVSPLCLGAMMFGLKTQEAESIAMIERALAGEVIAAVELARIAPPLALDNFDVTGQWRIRENGMPLDTEGEFYDGTTITTPAELRQVLLKRPIPLVRTFTQNLLAFALGRRVEFYDGPTVRRIARRAANHEYRMTEFILGVVESEPFRQQRAAPEAAAPAGGN